MTSIDESTMSRFLYSLCSITGVVNLIALFTCAATDACELTRASNLRERDLNV